MDLDDNTTKIILGLIALLTVIVSGALISIKKTWKKNTRNTISNVKITGDKSKVVGGDDNSRNK
jgi:glucose uptake protein GlcU